MCQCYQIGGPFIAEDPDCPVHGTEAQAARARQEAEESDRDARITAARITALEQRVAALEAKLGRMP